MKKLLRKNNKLLLGRNSKKAIAVAPEDCPCDPCNKWWCVIDGDVTNCVEAATEPANALPGGPYSSSTECEQACSEYLWWCVLRGGVRGCILSDTEPIDKVPGTTGYATSPECAAACAENAWWCVDLGGTFGCVFSITKPPNAVHDIAYATAEECEALCSSGCGYASGISVLKPSTALFPYSCREWFDDCTGGTSFDTCDGFLAGTTNGYYLDQWDPPDSAFGTRSLYNSPRTLDMFSYGARMVVRTGVTLRNSNRVAPNTPPPCGGGSMTINTWTVQDPYAHPIDDILLIWRVYTDPLPTWNSPLGQAQNQWFGHGQWFAGIQGTWGILPVAPAAGDRMEAEFIINPPSIAIGDIEYKTTYELLNLRLYRGNAVIWSLDPFPSKLFRRTPLCTAGIICGGIGREFNQANRLEYNASACDDIYWDIQN